MDIATFNQWAEQELTNSLKLNNWEKISLKVAFALSLLGSIKLLQAYNRTFVLEKNPK